MRLTLILSNCMKQRKKAWRDASTLILVRQNVNSNKYGPEYLMTERSKNSRFMAGGLCFPGGTVTAEDGAKEWIELYRKIGTNLPDLQFLQPGARRPEIYDSDPEPGSVLPKHISLRITAIRETFEECGILLCVSMDTNMKKVPGYEFLSTDSVILNWQSRIKENPGDFLTLCSELNVVPDLGALCEWSNWLTPVVYKSASRRFDTMFYIAFLQETPKIVIDTHEVGSVVWSTAEEFCNDESSGKRQLLPPQRYEMLRIRNTKSLETMKALVKSRLNLGLERWCPILKHVKDGLLGILPGDDLYPKDPDVYTFCETERLDKSIEELAKATQNHHRWQLPSTGLPPSVRIIIPDKYGQIYSS